MSARAWWMRLVGFSLTAVICVSIASAEDAARPLFSFDDTAAVDALIALNNLPLEVAAPPEAAPGGGPQGSALHVVGRGGDGVYAKRDAVALAGLDWPRVRTLTFWIFRPTGLTKPTPIEVQFMEADGKTRFWRRVDLDHSGWKRYDVPLRWFRWSTGRIPQWDAVVRVGFYCREAGEFWLDDVAVVEATEPNADGSPAAELSTEELRDFAFPDSAGKAKLERGKHVAVITDVGALDAAQLAAHLDEAAAAVAADLPFLGDVPQGRLVVFADRTAYQKFTVRTAEQLNSAAAPPTSGGFTFWGIATSYWDPDYGTLRPVYLHEFIHSYLDDALHLDNSGEWLHEGLASYYQLKFHPQDNFGDLVRNGLAARNFPPLEQVLNGKKIELTAYWQAATVIDMLLHDDAYNAKLPALVAAFQESGSTDLGPHLDKLGKSWDKFTADWEKFCARTY